MIWSLLFLFLASTVHGMGLSCQDVDTVLCLSFEDGSGTTARDLSRSGLTGTLNGGPIWAPQQVGMSGWGPPGNPNTLAQFPPHFIYFIGVNGEDVTTPVNTALDFSGNKPFMVISIVNPRAFANSVSPFNWCQAGNACGWDFETIWSGPYASYTFPGIAEHRFSMTSISQFNDNIPHSYAMWRDGSGNIDLYFDGKLNATFSGQTDMGACSGGSEFAVAKVKSGATEEYIGGVGPIQVWKNIVPRNQAGAFFRAWHNQWFGR